LGGSAQVHAEKPGLHGLVGRCEGGSEGTLEIGDSPNKDGRIVLESSYSIVAISTQKPTEPACFMVMIDR
jgi:hypothetical protein